MHLFEMYTFSSFFPFDLDPPGPIDNTKIAVTKCGNVMLRQGKFD